MIVRILRNAYKFFDRRWLMVSIAAILTIGIAELLSLVIHITLPLPSVSVPVDGGQKVVVSYTQVLDAGVKFLLLFLTNTWFITFVAFIAKTEINGKEVKVSRMITLATKSLPKTVFVNIIAQLLLSLGVIVASSMFLEDIFAVFLLIPSFLFAIWFSLVIPVAVIDDKASRIRDIFLRSRMLVFRNFWTMLAVLIIASLPNLITWDYQADKPYMAPLLILINISAQIIEALVVVSAYINLRLAKGESINENPQEATNESKDI